MPSVNRGTHGFAPQIWNSAALLSLSVRPVRFVPLPCRIPNLRRKTLSDPKYCLFSSWQGNGMRRTGRTPIDVNAVSCQKTCLLRMDGRRQRTAFTSGSWLQRNIWGMRFPLNYTTARKQRKRRPESGCGKSFFTGQRQTRKWQQRKEKRNWRKQKILMQGQSIWTSGSISGPTSWSVLCRLWSCVWCRTGCAHAGCLWKRSQKRYGGQTVFWKEAVMYVCWMWEKDPVWGKIGSKKREDFKRFFKEMEWCWGHKVFCPLVTNKRIGIFVISSRFNFLKFLLHFQYFWHILKATKSLISLGWSQDPGPSKAGKFPAFFSNIAEVTDIERT